MGIVSGPNILGALLEFRRSASAQAVGIMALTSGIGQLAILGTLPLLSRFYEPAAFGLHASFMAFVGIITVPVCLCLEHRIVSTPDEKAADEMYAGALMSIPITACIGACILVILIAFNLFNYAKLTYWCVPLLVFMVAMNGVYIASRSRLIRQKKFGTVARAGLSQNVARALAPIVTFLFAPFWIGLTAGEFIGRSVGVLGLAKRVWRLRVATSVWGQPSAWWALVRREYVFTGILVGTVIIDACASQLISPIMAATYGAQATGEYFMASLMTVGPSVLVGAAAADVLHAKGSEVYFRDPQALPALARKSGLLLLALGVAIFLPLYVIAPYLLPKLLGAKWVDIGSAVRAFMPFALTAFVASPCSRLLASVNKPSIKVIPDCIRLIGMPVVIYGSHAAGATFIRALWNLSWFLAAAYLLYFALTYAVITAVAREAAESG